MTQIENPYNLYEISGKTEPGKHFFAPTAGIECYSRPWRSLENSPQIPKNFRLRRALKIY